MSDTPTPIPAGEEHLSVEFMIERWLDAIKTSGTANSGGLFFAGVGIYYFSTTSPYAGQLLKYSAILYAVGVFFFTFAYIAFATFIDRQYTTDLPQRRLERIKLAGYRHLWWARTDTIIATALWFMASAIGIAALCHLKA